MREISESWRPIFRRFYELLEEIREKHESDLRFNVPYLTVSELSKQYYCEKKVELTRVLGKVEREQQIIGQKAHELLLKNTSKIEHEEAYRNIFSDKPQILREMPLLAKIKDIIVIGIADAVCFYSGFPLCLFEYKFTNFKKPFRDMHVQARLYGLLLTEMGFNTKVLKYAIILTPPASKESAELYSLPPLICKKMVEHKLQPVIKHREAKIFINNFDPSEALKDFEWTIGYWFRQREAKPTSKPAKCKACEYSKQCEYRRSANLSTSNNS